MCVTVSSCHFQSALLILGAAAEAMGSDAIYLLSNSGELRRIEHQLYASEDILQELVAKYPDVLAGDQIAPDAPPRWLLIRREPSIPDSVDGEDRWWLDHLLLD